jgi:hypothetical protein
MKLIKTSRGGLLLPIFQLIRLMVLAASSCMKLQKQTFIFQIILFLDYTAMLRLSTMGIKSGNPQKNGFIKKAPAFWRRIIKAGA